MLQFFSLRSLLSFELSKVHGLKQIAKNRERKLERRMKRSVIRTQGKGEWEICKKFRMVPYSKFPQQQISPSPPPRSRPVIVL